MLERASRQAIPDSEAFGAWIRNPLWEAFLQYMEENYRVAPDFAFSQCSWEPGWNARFRKGGRALCTVYPRENYFTVMITIGPRERDAFEKALSGLCPATQKVYRETREGNGQRWLMLDVEEDDERYADVRRLLKIRAGK